VNTRSVHTTNQPLVADRALSIAAESRTPAAQLVLKQLGLSLVCVADAIDAVLHEAPPPHWLRQQRHVSRDGCDLTAIGRSIIRRPGTCGRTRLASAGYCQTRCKAPVATSRCHCPAVRAQRHERTGQPPRTASAQKTCKQPVHSTSPYWQVQEAEVVRLHARVLGEDEDALVPKVPFLLAAARHAVNTRRRVVLWERRTPFSTQSQPD